MNPEEAAGWANAATAAINMVKEVIGLLPAKERGEAQEKLKKAEDELGAARAHFAKDLGYDLCRNHWPPGIFVRSPNGKKWCDYCKAPQPSPKMEQTLEEGELSVLRHLFKGRVTARGLATKAAIDEGTAQFRLNQLQAKGMAEGIHDAAMLVLQNNIQEYQVTLKGQEEYVRSGAANELPGSDLDPNQLATLEVLFEEAVGADVIARKLQVTPGTAEYVMGKLQEQGLITRVQPGVIFPNGQKKWALFRATGPGKDIVMSRRKIS